MTTVLLIRHGRTSANTSGVLAGRSSGVVLDEVGHQQAAEVAARVADVPLRTVLTSPLRRCRQTAQALVASRGESCPIQVEQGLVECGYGEWTGQPLKKLAKDPLWKVVQLHPSAARFPGGESMAAMSARAVAAMRDWDAAATAQHGPDALWLACSHGDVIKAIVADALGVHFDQFQRIVVDPGSLTVIRYTPTRPFLVRLNDTGGDLRGLLLPKRSRRRRATSDAVVGGGAG